MDSIRPDKAVTEFAEDFLVVWEREGSCPLCGAIQPPCLHVRWAKNCSKERGCWCEAMGEQNARRERELRDRDKRARVALAREESRG